MKVDQKGSKDDRKSTNKDSKGTKETKKSKDKK